VIIVKRSDDDFDVLTSAELDPEQVGDLCALEGVSSGLLSDEDAATAAMALQPNSLRLLVVYENLWSLPFRRARRPRVLTKELVMGLIGGMARTAVVAGTATAVGNREANRWVGQDQSQYAQPQYARPQYAAPQYVEPQHVQAAPAAAAAPDPIDQLKQLAELKNQGILTEEEFAAQKAKILGA
jgi:hypothetical protein